MGFKIHSGSLCLSDLNAKAKELHSAYSKSSKNNKIYVNVVIFENDEPDQYGNTMSVQLSAKKDAPEHEKKIYVGNIKPMPKSEPEPLTEESVEVPSDDDLDLPFN